MSVCDTPRRGHIMLISRCSSLRIQVTRFDWELNSPNLNIFISIQSLTQHCFKRICNHLHQFLLIFLMLVPDHFLVFSLSLGQVLRESKVSVDVRYLEGVGWGEGLGWSQLGKRKLQFGDIFCQPFFINFLWLTFPVIGLASFSEDGFFFSQCRSCSFQAFSDIV